MTKSSKDSCATITPPDKTGRKIALGRCRRKGNLERITAPIGVVEQLEGEGEDDRDKNGADEAGAAGDDHARADPGAEELPGAHDQAGREMNFAGGEEKEERAEVAGEIHDFRVAGRAREVESQAQHEGHGPERAGARAEKAVVKANEQAEYQVKPAARHPGMKVFGPKARFNQHVDGDRNQ